MVFSSTLRVGQWADGRKMKKMAPLMSHFAISYVIYM